MWRLAYTLRCRMKAKWLSCVLGLLCMPAEVILNTWTAAFQSPSTISNLWVNSSLEIKCTTSLENPMGLSLKSRFRGDEQILYLHFKKGGATKNTANDRFQNRIRITEERSNPEFKYGFKLQLSLLGLDDTDLYYCSWIYMDEKTYTQFHLESNGTVIIVREGRPMEECSAHTGDLTLITLSIVAVTAILLMFVSVMIVRCRMQFKKRFSPCRPYAPPLAPRPPRPPRPNQPRGIYPQLQTVDRCSYMMTSTNNYGLIGNL